VLAAKNHLISQNFNFPTIKIQIQINNALSLILSKVIVAGSLKVIRSPGQSGRTISVAFCHRIQTLTRIQSTLLLALIRMTTTIKADSKSFGAVAAATILTSSRVLIHEWAFFFKRSCSFQFNKFFTPANF
jgi:hypothetical protein